MMLTSPRRMLVLALSGVLALAACDSSTEPPPAAIPAEIEVTPAEVTLEELGATAELEVAVYDEDGILITNAEVEFTSSDEEVATVDEDGLVTAEGEGTATVTATSGEVSADVEVTVTLNDD